MTDILSAIAAENGIIESTDTPNTDTNNQAATTDAAEENKKRELSQPLIIEIQASPNAYEKMS